jgi:hypothetical protein
VELRRTQGAPFWAASVCGLRRRHDPRPDDELPKPLVEYRSFGPLAALGAGFDFATRRFRQVSQVMVLARPRPADRARLIEPTADPQRPGPPKREDRQWR